MWHLKIILIVLFASSSGLSLASNNDIVRKSYSGTTELPDGIAFKQFLLLVSGSDEDTHQSPYESAATTLVASALGLPLTKQTYPLIQERISLFREALAALRADERRAAARMVCAESRVKRTREETYSVLNSVDDVHEIIATQHFLITVAALPKSEGLALRDFLQKVKLGTSYAKLDSSVVFEKQNLDVHVMVEQHCNKQSAGS